MKRLLAMVVFAASLNAHPSVSVVLDSHGNAYYSDLEQVWRVTPGGQRSIVVPNVHTHELWIDAKDNLYGEHLWYNGEQLNTWGSRVWRRSPDGRVVDVVPSHDGFNDYSFIRDRAGNSYRADRDKNNVLRCAATCTPIGHANFRDIRWMTVTPDGVVYVIDKVDLMRVQGGRVTTVARNLSSESILRPWANGHHLLMGLWLDRAGNVHVADYADGEVKRIDARGKVTVVQKSPYPWSPTGGTFAPNGDLWLLEFNMNAARLRLIGSHP